MTAQTVPSTAAEATATDAERPRQLWQAPLFVLGVTALVTVLVCRAGADDPGRQVRRDLDQARQLLARPDGDAETAAGLLRLVLQKADHLPVGEGEVWYLLGSAELRLAARASAETAPAHFQAASSALHEAERLGVPEADRLRFLYRLAKADFYTEPKDLKPVVERLRRVAEFADDRAEAYDLLTQACLKLEPRDLEGALQANEQYRNVPEVGDKERAPAQLLGGELLLQLGKTDEARRVLDKISPKAPPAVLIRARMLQAQSLQEENRWSEAVTQWQKLLVEGGDAVPEPASILFQVGLCYRQLGRSGDAAGVWEDCLRRAKGEEAAAAALFLADLTLQGTTPEKALDHFETAVRGVTDAEHWSNRYHDLERIRELFERGVQVFRSAGKYEQALTLVQHYRPLAPTGRDLVLTAETTAQWAASRAEKLRTLPADSAKEEAETVNRIYLQAGEAYAAAAERATDPAVRADLLWLSASRFRDGDDQGRAAEKLALLQPMELRPERAIEVRYLLAESLKRLGNLEGAEKAYVDCISVASSSAVSSPFPYRARHQIALQHIDRGEVDKAVDILEQNLKFLSYEPDIEALEKSLFTLGELFYYRKNYWMAARRLEEGLDKFKDNPQAPHARFLLAESYRHLANEEAQKSWGQDNLTPETKAHYQSEHRRWLLKAADTYLDLAHFLEKPENAQALTAEERLQIPFQAADCRFNLGQYQEALQIYGFLAEKYPKQPAGLNAIGGMVRCHSVLNEPDKVRERLEQIRQNLDGLDDKERQQWEAWLTIASKPLQNP